MMLLTRRCPCCKAEAFIFWRSLRVNFRETVCPKCGLCVDFNRNWSGLYTGLTSIPIILLGLLAFMTWSIEVFVWLAVFIAISEVVRSLVVPLSCESTDRRER